ncbi:MAG: hypothetical protein ABL931_15005 [Usitatibacteraceae bacterium]
MPSFTELLLYIAIIFALNVVPAFAPPTWMALSWIGFAHPLYNPFIIAIIAAAAATAGRVTLAKLARIIIRQRFMSEASRANIAVIKEAIEGHRGLTAGTFLSFAFAPVGSNFLFIAYGLTVFAGAEVSQRLGISNAEAKNYFGVYFVASQFLFMGAVYVFTRIDWKHAVKHRRLRWLRSTGGAPPRPQL